MRRAEEPEVREVLRNRQAQQSAEAAEKATARLLATIEADGAGPVPPAFARALQQHGAMLRRVGGPPLVQSAFSRLCAVAPERAARRFDVLGRAWGEFLSRKGQP